MAKNSDKSRKCSIEKKSFTDTEVLRSFIEGYFSPSVLKKLDLDTLLKGKKS